VTRDELQTYVLDRLGIGTSDSSRVTQIVGLLNLYYEEIVALTRATYATATVTFPLASQLVTLPTDILAVEALRGSSGKKLRPVTPGELERYAGLYTPGSGGVPSIPAFYAWHSRTVCRVWPPRTGTADTNATCLYTQTPTLMTAGGNSPTALPVWAHRLIGEAAVYNMAMSEESWEQVDRSHRLLLEEFPRLIAWSAERSGGQLATSGMDNDLSSLFPSSATVRAGQGPAPVRRSR
jgi:hypothetical protein